MFIGTSYQGQGFLYFLQSPYLFLINFLPGPGGILSPAISQAELSHRKVFARLGSPVIVGEVVSQVLYISHCIARVASCFLGIEDASFFRRIFGQWFKVALIGRLWNTSKANVSIPFQVIYW
jgi:hypothetical protein